MLKWSPRTRKNKVLRNGFAGCGEAYWGPCGILLHLSRASQLPYSEKSENCRRPIILDIFLMYSLLIPFGVAYGAQIPAAPGPGPAAREARARAQAQGPMGPKTHQIAFCESWISKVLDSPGPSGRADRSVSSS